MTIRELVHIWFRSTRTVVVFAVLSACAGGTGISSSSGSAATTSASASSSHGGITASGSTLGSISGGSISGGSISSGASSGSGSSSTGGSGTSGTGTNTGGSSGQGIGSADEIHYTVLDSTSVAFAWQGSASVLFYGVTNAYGQSVAGATPAIAPNAPANGTFWQAQISGLSPNTIYHYSIGSGPDETFHTSQGPGASGFTMDVEGDVGDSMTYSNVAVVQSELAQAQPDFVLVVGDLTYGDQNGLQTVPQHFNDVMPWSQNIPYMPAWGNHDWDSPDSLGDYVGRFVFPNPQVASSSSPVGSEDWYWFDYGNTRFIAYPEPYDDNSWPDWAAVAGAIMDQAQQSAQLDFIVTFGHRPAYSSGYHAGDSGLAGLMAGLAASHSKYVLNINGHSHDYERTTPQGGVTHVTVGTGGSVLETSGNSCPWEICPAPSWSAFRVFHEGYLELQFSVTQITGTFVCGPSTSDDDTTCSAGSTLDSFTIQ